MTGPAVLTAVVPVYCANCGSHIHVTLRAVHHPGRVELRPDPADLAHAQIFARQHVGPFTVAGHPA